MQAPFVSLATKGLFPLVIKTVMPIDKPMPTRMPIKRPFVKELPDLLFSISTF
jgi:hypothetical protein